MGKAEEASAGSQPGAGDCENDDIEAASRSAETAGKSSRPRAALVLATAAVGIALLLVCTSAAGAAVLVWWAVNFHPDDEQTWMVPVGLVMFGTPIVAWFSVFASDFTRRFERRKAVVGSGVNGYEMPPRASSSSSAAVFTVSGPGGVVEESAGTDVKHDG